MWCVWICAVIYCSRIKDEKYFWWMGLLQQYIVELHLNYRTRSSDTSLEAPPPSCVCVCVCVCVFPSHLFLFDTWYTDAAYQGLFFRTAMTYVLLDKWTFSSLITHWRGTSSDANLSRVGGQGEDKKKRKCETILWSLNKNIIALYLLQADTQTPHYAWNTFRILNTLDFICY